MFVCVGVGAGMYVSVGECVYVCACMCMCLCKVSRSCFTMECLLFSLECWGNGVWVRLQGLEGGEGGLVFELRYVLCRGGVVWSSLCVVCVRMCEGVCVCE